MKKLTTLILLLSLLLSLLASCQGTAPTGSLPQTKQTAPLTEEQTVNQSKSLSQTTEETTDSQGTASYDWMSSEAFSALDEKEKNQYAVKLVEALLEDKKKFQMGKDLFFETGIRKDENGVPQGYAIPEEIQAPWLHLLDQCTKKTDCVWVTVSKNDPYNPTATRSVNLTVLLHGLLQKLHQEMVQADCPTVFLSANGEAADFIQYDNGAYVYDDTLLLFSDNGATKEYTLPNGAEKLYEIRCIAPYAFQGNEVLETVNLNNRVYDFYGIGIGAFLNCPNLKSINVHEDTLPVPTIAESFYDRYLRLLHGVSRDHLFVEGDYNTISDHFSSAPRQGESDGEALYRARKEAVAACLVTQPVDDNPKHYVVQDGVLVGYVGLGGHLVIPEGVTEIRADVFYSCRRNVLSVKLPSTLKKICTHAFVNLDYLAEIEIPKGVEVIETQAIVSPYDELVTTFETAIYAVNIPEDCRVAQNACTFVWPEKIATAE